MTASGPRRRVLLVSHRADLSGAPLCLWDLVETYDRGRFDLTVMLGEDGPLAERIDAAGVPVQVIDRKQQRGLARILTLRRQIGRWRPDVVHVFAAVALSKLVALAARSRGLPVLWHLHNSFDDAKFRRRLPWVRRLSTRIVCCAESVAAPIDSARTVVVRNGVREAEPGEDRPAAARALGLAAAPFRFAFVGAILPHKNVHLIVEALNRVRRVHPEVRLVAVGGGDKADYRRFVQQRIEELGLGGHVALHDPVADVTPYYRAADVLLLPSTTECYPRVVLEAAAHGRPTLAAPVGDLPRMIEHGRDGWLLGDGALDADRLGRAMLELRGAGRAAVETVGVAARERIAARHSLRRYTDDFQALWLRPDAALARARAAGAD